MGLPSFFINTTLKGRPSPAFSVSAGEEDSKMSWKWRFEALRPPWAPQLKPFALISKTEEMYWDRNGKPKKSTKKLYAKLGHTEIQPLKMMRRISLRNCNDYDKDETLLWCPFSFSTNAEIYLKNGIPFDVVAFNTLIKGLFAENKVEDAVELFKKLVRDKICEPNEVMYAIVMNGLCKRGHTQKTLSLLRLMEQDAAINILNEMKQKDVLPNIVTYNSIIDGLCKLGQWEKMDYAKEGKVKDAEEVMKHMVEKGVEPNIITYSALMDGYCLRGQVNRARRIFDSLREKGIETDIFSYNILIKGYCKKKKVDDAMQLFCEISQKGSKPDIVAYNTILQGLFEVGRTGDAKQIYAEMLSAGTKPNIYSHVTLLNIIMLSQKEDGCVAGFLEERLNVGLNFILSAKVDQKRRLQV
ncbi:hypothetical protein MTR67_025365 [Solanum verrucosum]|uniref:Pentatricopeptide repeat-containing protein n=1 Tax=Solanum verrucosum TaxID=315347 RepID=A0AAF0R3F0_SOLVR|nr:hypothetical protein MTR67_025365 [Solanum verrucosum]